MKIVVAVIKTVTYNGFVVVSEAEKKYDNVLGNNGGITCHLKK